MKAVKNKNSKRNFDLSPYFFILPALIIVIIFLLIPTIYAFFLSFTDAALLTVKKAQFIGAGNLVNFVRSGAFRKVIGATLSYVIGGVSLTYVFGLATAILLNQKFIGRAIARSILILPWAVPQIVLVIIWRWMLNPGFGIVNYILNKIGILPSLGFSWFTTPTLAMVAVLTATIWKQYPLGCLILLGGLQSISTDLYEAASIDGASSFGKFRYITIPGLKYVTTILILLLTIWHFTNFTVIWLLTQGGPSEATSTLTIYTYLNAFKFHKLGYGAFLGTITFFISLVFSVFYYILVIKKVDRDLK